MTHDLISEVLSEGLGGAIIRQQYAASAWIMYSIPPSVGGVSRFRVFAHESIL